MLRLRLVLLFSASLLLIACGDDDGAGSDAGGSDTGTADGGADTGTMDSGGTDAGDDAGDDAGGDDAGDVDAGDVDAGDVDAGTDAGDVDAGPRCEGNMPGFCTEPGTTCLSCPAGGPRENYLCTTTCMDDDDCPGSDRPVCNQMNPRTEGICTPREFTCAWGAICASPDTPIATPDGDRPIAELQTGDLVYTVENDQIVAVPIALTGSTAVSNHRVMQVTLATGDVLEISGGHPTAEGELFADLQSGDALGDIEVVAVREIPYGHAHTYDILPASESGTYFAAGALIGSTLAH